MDKATMPVTPPEPQQEEPRARAQPEPLYGALSRPPMHETDVTQRIVSRLQQAPDTESALRIALEELGTLLGARAAVGRLGTQKQLLSSDLETDES